MRKTLAALLFLVAAGCGTTAVIGDISQDKVIVEASGDDKAVIEAKAAEGCGLYGRRAIPLSKQCQDAYCMRVRYLFACQP